MVKAKKWVIAKHFVEFPKDSDIQIVEEELPQLTEGQCLVQAVFQSVDPYMRPYMSSFPEGATMIGQQVAKVIESKWADYPVGTLVVARVGWRSHTIMSKDAVAKDPFLLYKVQDCITKAGFSSSLGLGILGMTGCTAYFGLMKICDPQPGEVVLVNGGAGAVGSAVGQIAKIKGCKVIGYAGSEAKCEYMKKLGFDHVYNYKTVDLETSLKEAAPDGVDCFFDNVGGEFLNTVLNHMKLNGRISICGAISQYNKKKSDVLTLKLTSGDLIGKRMRIEGFIVSRWLAEWPAAIEQMTNWITEGKLKYDEHVTEGFERTREAFFAMLKGENTGKAVVKC